MKYLILFLLLSCNSSNNPQLEMDKRLFSKKEVTKIDPSQVPTLDEVKKNIKQKKLLSYKEARRFLFGEIHLEGKGISQGITDIYCNKKFTNSDIPSQYKIGEGKIPDHKILNAEHVWPKSRFFGKSRRSSKKRKGYEYDIREADLHILYPSSSKVNSTRSSYKFGDVDDSRQSEKIGCSDAQIGKAILKGKPSKSLFFEPPKISKGNVARAMFYFSVRYDQPIEFYEEQFLKKWHELDPPDDKERARNDKIEAIQGNRNPFIDYPQLVREISDF